MVRSRLAQAWSKPRLLSVGGDCGADGDPGDACISCFSSLLWQARRFEHQSIVISQGLPTIRAYGAGPRFLAAFIGALDANGAWWFAFISTARWIGFRLDFISAVMLTAGSILAMAIHDKVAFPTSRTCFLHFVAVLGLFFDRRFTALCLDVGLAVGAFACTVPIIVAGDAIATCDKRYCQ